jgi:aspartate 1-decarboxylase
MLRCVLRAKIHMATVTDSNISYDGSITVDEKILEKSGIIPYERVMVGNLNNGERFETYVIPGKKGSGEICLNGPTARKGVAGDKIIIFCYSYIDESKLKQFKPTIVFLDGSNKIISVK